MPDTFTLIASSTVGAGGATAFDFTSIPSTYTDLCLKFSARVTDSGAVFAYLTFNNSGGTAYSYRNLYGISSAAYSDSNSSFAYVPVGYTVNSSQTASTFSNGEVYVPNYAGSTNKSFSNDGVAESNSATGVVNGFTAGLWANTAAINRITLTAQAGSFVQYSTAYLYGVKNA